MKWILPIASLALVFLVLCTWATIFTVYGVDVPVADQWDTPLRQLALDHAGELTLEELARQHNEARKVVPNLVAIAVTRVAGHYDTCLESFVAIVIFAGTLAALAVATRRATTWTASAAIAAWLTALGWSAHTSRLHMYSTSFERLLPEFALAVALALLVLRGVTWPATLAACALASFAQYSFGSGIAVWGLLFAFVAIRAHGERAALAKTACVMTIAILSSALYFHGYESPPQHGPMLAILGEPPWRIVGFLLAFLGNAFTRNLVLAVLLGAVGLAGYCWLVWRFVRRPAAPATRPVELMWVLLGAYAITQGAMAAAGRLALDFDHASRPDYVAHAVYLYVAIAALVLLRVAGERRRQVASAVVVAAAVVASATLSSDRFWSDLQRRQQARRHAKACLLLHRLHWDATCLAQLYEPSLLAERIASAVPLLRPAPLESLRIEGAGQGAVERIEGDAERTRISGWAVQSDAPADAVVVTAASNGPGPEAILAIAAVIEPRPDIAGRISMWGDRAGWEAQLDAPIDACQLRAHAFDTRLGVLHPLPGSDVGCPMRRR